MFCLNRESCLMGGAGSLPVDSLGASRAVYVVKAIIENQFVQVLGFVQVQGFFVT